MKKLLFIFILGFPFAAISQQKIQPTLPLKAINKIEIDKFIAKVESATKYKVAEIDSANDDFGNRNIYAVILKSADNTNEIRITYPHHMEGENKALERKGTKVYYFESISGTRYLDLFEIWKRFFDPNADAVKIAGTSSFDRGSSIIYRSPITSNVDPSGSNRIAKFNESGGSWRITK